MKSTILSTILFAAFSTASPLSTDTPAYYNSSEIVWNGDGDPIGPLKSCGGDPGLFILDQVILDPYPIQTGSDLIVRANGVLLKQVVPGATINVVGKLGFIKVVEEQLDLCEEISKTGMVCPVQPGNFNFEYRRAILASYPSASISLDIRIKTIQGDEIICLAGKVQLVKG